MYIYIYIYIHIYICVCVCVCVGGWVSVGMGVRHSLTYKIHTREYSVKLFLNSALNPYEYIISERSLFDFLTSTDYRESESEREIQRERE